MNILYRLLLPLVAIFAAIPLSAQNGEGKPLYTISVDRDGTPLGEIVVELFPDIAPLHVRNFDSLVSIGFYDGTAFHRVIPGFVIQGGDPNSRDKPKDTWGQGAPGQQTVPAEFSKVSHRRGVLSAARADDINSATSQFFICHADALGLDGRYTVYGRVVSGLNLVDTIVMAPRDAADNPFQKHSMRITRTGIDTTLVGAPQLLLPVDATRYVPTGLSLKWDSVPGAILYEIQVAADDAFTVADTSFTSTTTSYALNGLKRGLNQYFWRVRATNGGRRGAFSEARRFTTSVVAPAISEPATGATNVSKPTTLRWNRVAGATSYRLQLSSRLTYNPLIVNLVDLTDTSATITGLDAATKYYWRVQAVQDTTAGPYSINANFTTDAVSSVPAEELSSGSALSLRVVMTESGSALLRGRLDRNVTARVDISDLTGRMVRRFDSRAFDAGDFMLPLDLSGLAAGTYLIRLHGEGLNLARPIQVR